MRTVPDPRDAWSPEEARRLLDEHRRVGGSLAEFARQRGISPARLYWWRKRLGDGPASLAELSLVPATVVSAGATIAIRLPNGIVIELGHATPEMIARVVNELARSVS